MRIGDIFGIGMANFARERRSPGCAAPAASVTSLTPRPQRRAFDLIKTIAPAPKPRLVADERPLSAYEARAAETLMAIARAMVPTRDEVMALAALAGIDAMRYAAEAEPKLVAMVAARLPVRAPDLAASRAYYQVHLESFRLPDLHDGREILIAGDVQDWDWRQEAYARAERIIAMLHYDRRVFNDLLIYSSAPTRAQSGRVGPVARGRWESEAAPAFFSLKPGDVFPLPVPSSRGFHVLIMDRVEAGRLRPFAEAEPEITGHLAERARLEAAKRHLAVLGFHPALKPTEA